MNRQEIFRSIAERQKQISAAIKKGRGGYAATHLEKYVGIGKDQLYTGNLNSADLSKKIASNAVSFVISTENIDRDGDVVRSLGGDYSGYKKNSCIFWGHQSWEIPIGTATSPEGELCVYPEKGLIRSTCFFDMGDPDAVFLLGKVRRKIISATSVAFVPIEAQRRDTFDKSHHEQQGPVGWDFLRWAITEYSLVGVPSNKDAVIIGEDFRNSYDHEKSFISPRLHKSLLQYAAKSKGRCFSGWCPTCIPCEKGIQKDAKSDAVNEALSSPSFRHINNSTQVDGWANNQFLNQSTAERAFPKDRRGFAAAVVEEWKRRNLGKSYKGYQPGNRVRITHGPDTGVKGTVLACKDGDSNMRVLTDSGAITVDTKHCELVKGYWIKRLEFKSLKKEVQLIPPRGYRGPGYYILDNSGNIKDGPFTSEDMARNRDKGLKKPIQKMEDKDRDRLRKLQDKLINSAGGRKFASDHGENKPVFEGGPSISQLRSMLYPKWEYMIEGLVRDLGIKSIKSKDWKASVNEILQGTVGRSIDDYDQTVVNYLQRESPQVAAMALVSHSKGKWQIPKGKKQKLFGFGESKRPKVGDRIVLIKPVYGARDFRSGEEGVVISNYPDREDVTAKFSDGKTCSPDGSEYKLKSLKKSCCGNCQQGKPCCSHKKSIKKAKDQNGRELQIGDNIYVLPSAPRYSGLFGIVTQVNDTDNTISCTSGKGTGKDFIVVANTVVRKFKKVVRKRPNPFQVIQDKNGWVVINLDYPGEKFGPYVSEQQAKDTATKWNENFAARGVKSLGETSGTAGGYTVPEEIKGVFKFGEKVNWRGTEYYIISQEGNKLRISDDPGVSSGDDNDSNSWLVNVSEITKKSTYSPVKKKNKWYVAYGNKIISNPFHTRIAASRKALDEQIMEEKAEGPFTIVERDNQFYVMGINSQEVGGPYPSRGAAEVKVGAMDTAKSLEEDGKGSIADSEDITNELNTPDDVGDDLITGPKSKGKSMKSKIVPSKVKVAAKGKPVAKKPIPNRTKKTPIKRKDNQFVEDEIPDEKDFSEDEEGGDAHNDMVEKEGDSQPLLHSGQVMCELGKRKMDEDSYIQKEMENMDHPGVRKFLEEKYCPSRQKSHDMLKEAFGEHHPDGDFEKAITGESNTEPGDEGLEGEQAFTQEVNDPLETEEELAEDEMEDESREEILERYRQPKGRKTGAKKSVKRKGMPSNLKTIWDRIKGGGKVEVDDAFLDAIGDYFQRNDDPDDSLFSRLASTDIVGRPGKYNAFIKSLGNKSMKQSTQKTCTFLAQMAKNSSGKERSKYLSLLKEALAGVPTVSEDDDEENKNIGNDSDDFMGPGAEYTKDDNEFMEDDGESQETKDNQFVEDEIPTMAEGTGNQFVEDEIPDVDSNKPGLQFVEDEIPGDNSENHGEFMEEEPEYNKDMDEEETEEKSDDEEEMVEKRKPFPKRKSIITPALESRFLKLQKTFQRATGKNLWKD